MSRNTTNVLSRSLLITSMSLAVTLSLAPVAWAVCGDTALDTGEQCDDGNVANGDGCDSLCAFETSGDLAVELKMLSDAVKSLSHGIDVAGAEAVNTRLHAVAGAALGMVNTAVSTGNLESVEKVVDKSVSKVLKISSKLDRIGQGVTSGKILLTRAALDEMSDRCDGGGNDQGACTTNADCPGGGTCSISELNDFAEILTPQASQIYGTSNPDLCPPFDCSMAATESRSEEDNIAPMSMIAEISPSPVSVRNVRASPVPSPAGGCGSGNGLGSLLASFSPGSLFVGEAEAKTLLPCVPPCKQPLSGPCLKCLAAVAPQLQQCTANYNATMNGCCTCKWWKPWCCACRTTATIAYLACVA